MKGTATGIVFQDADVGGLKFGLQWLLELWDSPDAWKKVQKAAIETDNSWQVAAQRYVEMYEEMLG